MFSLFSFFAQAENTNLPQEWYINPEDQEEHQLQPMLKLPWTKKAKMEKLVKTIYQTNRASVEGASKNKSTVTGNKDIPNWTPWHLEAFTTELAVMNSGLIGVLTGKGTATVQAYWRKQEPKTTKSIEEKHSTMLFEENDAFDSLNAEEISNEDSFTRELEPIIKSVLSTKKVKDELAFRRNIETAAHDFMDLINSFQTETKSKWWVSGVRLEFSVSASGKLVPAAPVVSVGGDVRVRFSWKRIKQKNSIAKLTPRQVKSPLQNKIQNFVTTLTRDLDEALDENLDGFKPYAFRIGLGFTASGNVGIAKSSASAIASVSFATDVKAPVVRSKPMDASAAISPLLLVENKPSDRHIQFATNNAIPFSLEKNNARAVFTIDNGKFKNGLKKAVKMASLFVKAGKSASSAKWKLYQIKTGFDLSITGDVGLAKYGGVTSAELAFYNIEF